MHKIVGVFVLCCMRSFGMFINRVQDPVIERIEKRISLITHVPVSHQEAIQVLRYTKGQTYRAHYDSGAEKGGRECRH